MEKYSYVGTFNANIAPASKDDGARWGFIDREGKEVIPFIFLWTNDFDSKGTYGTVTLENKSNAFIDRSGNIVSKEYHDCLILNDVMRIGNKSGKQGELDPNTLQEIWYHPVKNNNGN